MSEVVARKSEAESRLAAIETPADALKAADWFETLRFAAQQADADTAQVNSFTADKAMALKKMAELVDEGQVRGEIAKPGDRPNVCPSNISTLDDLGVSRWRLHEARKLEPLTVEAIKEIIDAANEDGREISCGELARIGDQLRRGQTVLISEQNERYTPACYIESARAVMGGIDVDPASDPLANETVRAGVFYTLSDDGLAHEWPGRVWLNPPYGGDQVKFIARLMEQTEAGTTKQAVVLVNAHATDTTWFAPLWDHTLCFTDHRINFYGSPGGGSTHGSVFVYLGPNICVFAREFDQWGNVVRRVRKRVRL